MQLCKKIKNSIEIENVAMTKLLTIHFSPSPNLPNQHQARLRRRGKLMTDSSRSESDGEGRMTNPQVGSAWLNKEQATVARDISSTPMG